MTIAELTATMKSAGRRAAGTDSHQLDMYMKHSSGAQKKGTFYRRVGVGSQRRWRINHRQLLRLEARRREDVFTVALSTGDVSGSDYCTGYGGRVKGERA
jgi:hypothetical protein